MAHVFKFFETFIHFSGNLLCTKNILHLGGSSRKLYFLQKTLIFTEELCISFLRGVVMSYTISILIYEFEEHKDMAFLHQVSSQLFFLSSQVRSTCGVKDSYLPPSMYLFCN